MEISPDRVDRAENDRSFRDSREDDDSQKHRARARASPAKQHRKRFSLLNEWAAGYVSKWYTTVYSSGKLTAASVTTTRFLLPRSKKGLGLIPAGSEPRVLGHLRAEHN